MRFRTRTLRAGALSVAMGAITMGIALGLTTSHAAAQQAGTPENIQSLEQKLDKSIEERLKRLEALERRLEALEKAAEKTLALEGELKDLKQSVADEQIAVNSQRGVKLTIGGQVNRALLYADNGTDEQLFNVDNDNASTRVFFRGDGRISEDLTAGALFEMEMESNSSGPFGNFADADFGGNGGGRAGFGIFTTRKIDIFFNSEMLGTLSMGLGDMASNGSAEMDLSGTAVASYSARDRWGGGFFPKADLTGSAIAPSAFLGNFAADMDGLGRNDRIRYDSPVYGGLQFSTSFGEGGRNDYALRYKDTLGGVRVAAAAALANDLDASDALATGLTKRVSSSLSALHPSGISATVAFARDFDPKGSSSQKLRPTMWYAKLGYETRLLKWGDTAFSIDYSRHNDMLNLNSASGDGTETDIWTLALVQELDATGTQLYAMYRHVGFDDVNNVPGFPAGEISLDNIDMIAVGARIKF